MPIAAPKTPTYEHQMAPGELTITERFGYPERRSAADTFRIVGRMSPTKKGRGRYRPLSANGNLVPIGRSLQFEIEGCTVQEPYDVYWKIRNYGEEAKLADSLRGDIHKDDGSRVWKETTSYIGHHYVEAMIVKEGLCVSKSRQDVIVI